MKMTRRETGLAIAVAALAIAGAIGPHVGHPAGYHEFVDARAWLGIPNAGDVLSNLAFLVASALGFAALWRLPARSLANMERATALLFFAGLAATTACSTWYHLQPDDARLAIDRSGMAIAFAGLLGLAAATHVGERAGALVALGLLLVAPWAIRAAAGGELLPWVLVQFGGMAALCVLAWVRPLPNALGVNWLAAVAIYALAKLAEANDGAIFGLTHHALSGHSLKHIVAAIAAAPLILALRERGSVQNGGRDPRRVPA